LGIARGHVLGNHRDAVWFAAGMPERPIDYSGPGDYLCIGCLECRLGRKLNRKDFTRVPINTPDRWNTDRLNDRLGVA
jgi:hypothetical protein